MRSSRRRSAFLPRPAAIFGLAIFGLAIFGLASVSAASALAAQQIVVRVGGGGTISIPAGSTANVPIDVDMSLAGGQDLASLTFDLSWDPSLMTYSSSAAGSFGTVLINEAQAASGVLTVSLFNATGTTSGFNAANVMFVMGPTAPSSKIKLTVKTAGDEQGADITGMVVADDLDVSCVGASGLWGDVTGDDKANIIDAQQATRFSVGLAVLDPQRMIDFGDVTADGTVDIIDAQQIASYSAGQTAAPLTGQPKPGTCGYTPPPPSTKFSLGARVSVTANLDVHGTPSTGGALLDTKAAGELGTVIGGPLFNESLWWWEIDYDTDPDGWSVEDLLVLSTPGPSAHWAFDETGGLTASDNSGNGNTGTLVNGPTWVAGHLSGALSFDGVNDHVTVSNDPSLNPMTQLTIAAWVNSNGGGAHNVIDKSIGNNTQYLLRLQSGRPRLLLWTTSGLKSLRASSTLSTATWHHVVVTYDGALASIYIDGVLDITTAHTGTIADNGAGVVIGASNTVTQRFNGSIDDLRIYDVALTASEVQALHALVSSPDVIPPTATMTSHATGTVVANQITLTADAADNVGVAGVQFYVDGAPVGTEDTTAPYAVVIDSNLFTGGPHSITAEARDGAGLTASSPAVVVDVDNAVTRPNVVVIMTDDQRWDGMGQMPLTMAHFATEGVEFSNSFVVAPICCPSRASFLTGQYAHNHGVLGNHAPYAAPSFKDGSTLPVWLHNAGYRTGLYGKYMNLYDQLAPYIPPGWDEWHVFDGSNGAFYNYSLSENGTTVPYGSSPADYSTDLLTNKAAQFIQATPVGQPFFLFLSIYAPHEPFTPAPADVGSLNGIPPWRPPSFNEADVSDKPAWIQNLPIANAAQVANSDAVNQSQMESLAAVDRAVDQVMAALTAANRLGETLVIFTSDNGLSWGEHRFFLDKDCAYEECVRVPLLVRVPGAVARVEDQLVDNTDLAVSIADWASVIPTSPTNGANLLDLISNPSTPWRSEVLIEVLSRGPERNFAAVHTDQYMYAEYENGDRELYDLAIDPYQLDNVFNDPAYAAVVPALQAALATLKAK